MSNGGYRRWTLNTIAYYLSTYLRLKAKATYLELINWCGGENSSCSSKRSAVSSSQIELTKQRGVMWSSTPRGGRNSSSLHSSISLGRKWQQGIDTTIQPACWSKEKILIIASSASCLHVVFTLRSTISIKARKTPWEGYTNAVPWSCQISRVAQQHWQRRMHTHSSHIKKSR